MNKSITPRQIKSTNRQLIFDCIYQNEKVSQQDISYALRLSRPTVASNLTSLEEDGLIYKNGQQDSELIGRKATVYSIVADHRIAIGVELMRREAKIIAVDLYGRELGRMSASILYRHEDAYYGEVCSHILQFIKEHGFRDEQILGIGFCMQGLVSSDGRTVVYGAILGNTGLRLEKMSSRLPYPCTFIHDPKCAAISELWKSPELSNAIYVSLSRHLGGAMINNGKVHAGNHGHNATFEHIPFDPGMKPCYCGKRGCMETVCSMEALLGDDNAEDFFTALRAGKAAQKKRWNEYLKNLARMIYSLHLVRDVDIILGGHLAPYLTQEDNRELYEKIRELNPFEEEDDFIVLSRMPSDNITIGAALVYIRAYLDNPEGQIRIQA